VTPTPEQRADALDWSGFAVRYPEAARLILDLECAADTLENEPQQDRLEKAWADLRRSFPLGDVLAMESLKNARAAVAAYIAEVWEAHDNAVARLKEVEAAARAFVEKVNGGEEASRGIFVLARLHGVTYRGPLYGKEKARLLAALSGGAPSGGTE
jgi:hypothetical protein